MDGSQHPNNTPPPQTIKPKPRKYTKAKLRKRASGKTPGAARFYTRTRAQTRAIYLKPWMLRARRLNANLSQYDFAACIGVSENAINLYENNKRAIPRAVELAVQGFFYERQEPPSVLHPATLRDWLTALWELLCACPAWRICTRNRPGPV